MPRQEGLPSGLSARVRRQAFSDLRPRTPIRPTVVRASVVLLEERTVAGGVPREFVDTLPPLRIRVREKTRPHAAVLHGPRASRVPGLEGADRADPDDEVLRFPWIDQDGMEAKTAAPRLPPLPRGVVVQGPEFLPRVAPVRGMEKESAFLRPDCHDDAVFLDRSYHVNHPPRWARYARRPPASMPQREAASSRGLRSRTSSHTDVVGRPRRQPDPGFPGTRNRAPSTCRRGPMHRGRLRPLPPCTNGGRAGSA